MRRQDGFLAPLRLPCRCASPGDWLRLVQGEKVSYEVCLEFGLALQIDTALSWAAEPANRPAKRAKLRDRRSVSSYIPYWRTVR